MFELCDPFEDFEYNVVGSHRNVFIFLEALLVLALTSLTLIAQSSPVKMFLLNIVLLCWPLVIIRCSKSVFTHFFPYEASKSSTFLCFLLRTEITLQYNFAIAHLLTISLFLISVNRQKCINFCVDSKMKKHFLKIDGFSLVFSTILVNLNEILGFLIIIYAFFTIFLFYFLFFLIPMVTVRCLIYQRKNEKKTYEFIWVFILICPSMFCHFYHTVASMFLSAMVFFEEFNGSFQVAFRTSTATLTLRFLVQIIISFIPMFLLPQILKPVGKFLQMFRTKRVPRQISVLTN